MSTPVIITITGGNEVTRRLILDRVAHYAFYPRRIGQLTPTRVDEEEMTITVLDPAKAMPT